MSNGEDDLATSGRTLLSVLEGIRNDTTDAFADVNAQNDGRITDPVCNGCAAQLPVLRRSLGRLENRLDNMVVLLKCLLTRQAALPRLMGNTPYTHVSNQPSTSGFGTISFRGSQTGFRTASVGSVSATIKEEGVPQPFLKRMLSRELIRYPGKVFSIGEFLRAAPKALKSVNQELLSDVLKELVANKILRRINIKIPLWSSAASYEKERMPARLGALQKYDITLNDYLKTF